MLLAQAGQTSSTDIDVTILGDVSENDPSYDYSEDIDSETILEAYLE